MGCGTDAVIAFKICEIISLNVVKFINFIQFIVVNYMCGVTDAYSMYWYWTVLTMSLVVA